MRRLNRSILTKKRRLSERPPLDWLLILSSLPLFGAATAYAVVEPVEVEDSQVASEALQTLALPKLSPPKATVFSQFATVESGDTLAGLLSRMGVTDPRVWQQLQALFTAKGWHPLQTGRVMWGESTADGRLLRLQYLDREAYLISIEAVKDRFSVHREPAKMSVEKELKAGQVVQSLFITAEGDALPKAVVSQLLNLVGPQIAEYGSPRSGDGFKVVYETLYFSGRAYKTGRVLAAEFTRAERTFQAIGLNDPSSAALRYYTPQGETQRAAAFQPPLEAGRISSGFKARLHPVIGAWVQHKGIDYPTPIGTPVKATADSIVAFVGVKKGFGKVVELKHGAHYTTLYGHLSAFKAGIQPGLALKQGEVIGFSGMTGWATGPHLHYEFRVNQQARNPLTAAFPVVQTLAPAQLAQFKPRAESLLAQLSLLRPVERS